MKPAMYIFINRGLGMSPGKIGAQAGHAAVEAALLSNGCGCVPMDDERAKLWDAWREGLHYVKYVMEARDTEHIMLIDKYLNERGFRTNLIIDEGHTEVPPMSATALGVALVDKDDPHTKATFSSFKLYKDSGPTRNELIEHFSRPFPGDPKEPKPSKGAQATLWGYPLEITAHLDSTPVDLTRALRLRNGRIEIDTDVAMNLLDVAHHNQKGIFCDGKNTIR